MDSSVASNTLHSHNNLVMKSKLSSRMKTRSRGSRVSTTTSSTTAVTETDMTQESRSFSHHNMENEVSQTTDLLQQNHDRQEHFIDSSITGKNQTSFWNDIPHHSHHQVYHLDFGSSRLSHCQESCSPKTSSGIEDPDNQVCFGCSLSLASSPMIASVSGHHKWHIDCLRCSECDDLLSQERTCFIKNGRIYCREDYTKLVRASIKCAKCLRQISPTDWVRRAGSSVYHLACFACDLCQRQLSTGEQFTIDTQSGPDSKLLCKLHFGINKDSSTGDSHDSSSNDSTSSSSLKPSKTKRVRTTFTEEQLQVLQANFQIDSNPDGQDLERIASLTGLSKRVTQVWFQNSRARQKKYMNKARGVSSSNSMNGVNATNGMTHIGSSSWSSGPPSVDPSMTSLSQTPWSIIHSQNQSDNNSHCSEDMASSPA